MVNTNKMTLHGLETGLGLKNLEQMICCVNWSYVNLQRAGTRYPSFALNWRSQQVYMEAQQLHYCVKVFCAYIYSAVTMDLSS